MRGGEEQEGFPLPDVTHAGRGYRKTTFRFKGATNFAGLENSTAWNEGENIFVQNMSEKGVKC
jgi:hypothetical protein